MTTPDIDLLAATAYATGIDPIHYATVHVIEAHVEIFLAVRDISAEIGCTLPHDTAALSRRILGDLMDAGWKAPGGIEIPEEGP